MKAKPTQKQNVETGTLPQNFSKYFWDCQFEQLTFSQYPRFIAERLLNYGDLPAIQWLLKQIKTEELKKIVNASRSLDKKTKNFWMIWFGEKKDCFARKTHRNIVLVPA